MAISTVSIAVDGQNYPLNYNSTSGRYEAVLTAPSKSSGSNNGGAGVDIGENAVDGYYPMTLTVTDDVGNVTTVGADDPEWGQALRLMVLETVKPVAEVIYPSTGSSIVTSAPTIRFTVTDSGSGVDPDACYVAIDGGTPVAATVSMSGNVANCQHTSSALSDGQHTISVYGVDFDGNESLRATSTFKIDTVAPALNVTSPASDLSTNVSQLTIAGTTSDATSGPVTLRITVGTASFEDVPVDSSTGEFSQTVTLSEGSNAITVVSTDAVGHSTTVTRTVLLDTVPPQIVSITLEPDPASAGRSYQLKVEVTDP